MMAFTLLPPPDDIHGRMAPVKGLLGHKHVTFGALGEGLIILFQDRKCVLHVVVHKLDLQVGLACLTFPDTPSSGIAHGLLGGGGSALTFLSHAVIGLVVGMKEPCSQIHSTLRAQYPLSQPLPIRGSFSLHPACVYLYQHSSRVVARLTHHDHCLLDIRI